MNVNKAIVVGYLTRSPEVRHAQNGNVVASFGVATNRAWTDPGGERQEEVEFHNVVAFGRQAEIAAEYLHKGDMAGVEGRLQTRRWERDGHTFSRTQIVVEKLHLGPKQNREEIADYDDSDVPTNEESFDGDGDQALQDNEVPF